MTVDGDDVTGTVAETFSRLADDGDGGRDSEMGMYTTLAPLYRAMYDARGRIEGQLATVTEYAPAGTTTVLELGCGTGALLDELGTVYSRAVGADRSPEMCRLAARNGPVVRGDASGFAAERIDLVVVVGAVLGHVRPDAAARTVLADVREVLRPGGRVVCSVHDSRGLDGPRERSLTRTVDGYEIRQTDRQQPTGGGEFEWRVSFVMTAPSGETRRVTTTTTLRAFTPDELVGWFGDVGLDIVETRPRTYVDGDGEDGRAFVLVGEHL